MPADQEHPDTPPRSTLKESMSRQSAEAKKSFAQRSGFSSSDYATLRGMVDEAQRKLASAGIPADRTPRLARHRRLLNDTIALLEDPDAEVIAPSDAEVYLTALEVGQLNHIVSQLATPNGHWLGALERIVGPGAGEKSAAKLDERFMLQFVALCRSAGFRLEPMGALAGRPDDQPREPNATLEIDHWRVGIAGRALHADADLEPAMQAVNTQLRAAKMPGLAVFEVTSLIWPERRVLRVASDSVASSELQRRADAFLVEHTDRLASLADPQLVFGVLAVATLPTFNVPTRHIAFSTSFRIAALCDDDDPRLARLTAFAKRFQRVGG